MKGTRSLRPSALALTWAMTVAVMSSMGCTHHFFKAKGTLNSQGSGPLGTWRATPLGCSRDAVEEPAGVRVDTVGTLLWDDMVSRDQFPPRDKRRLKNAPSRLEIWKTETGFAGKLETLKPTVSAMLDASVCGSFDVTTQESQPLIQGGRPALNGMVTLDCTTAGNHISGQIAFRGCEY